MPALLTFTALAAIGQPAEPIVRYDMTYLFALDLEDPAQRRRFWDETHLVASLQGLVNRDAPRLYIRYNQAPDDFWWERMAEPGGWLEGREVVTATSLGDLLARFPEHYRGVVVWDERVPATSNLASTIAGCEGLLCVRHDESPASLCQELRLPEVVRLMAADGGPLFTGSGVVPDTDMPSSGSAKCDAYLWLIEHYVKPGNTSPDTMGYYLDGFWLDCWHAGDPRNHTLTNQDYVIAHGGVLFDLNVWDDEAAVDDPAQRPGTDAETLQALLHAAYDAAGGEVIHVAGFTPWAYKYTDFRTDRWSAGGKHGGVPTEWRYAEILSCFNAYMDADALGLSAMANASFYQHYPLPERIPQNPKPTEESLTERGILDANGRIVPRHYYAHYVGDYDAAAWLYQMLPQMWTDPARGETPLSWAFNPNLAERFPLGMAWTRATRTPNDFFVAGDSGAGYLNPGYLSEPRPYSGLPSGMAAWERHCQRFFEQWDISLVGFVIDGYARGLTEEGLDAYARFSPGGIVPQKIDRQGLHAGMPFLRMGGDLPHDPAEAARVIRGGFGKHGPDFAVYRSILKPPSWYVEVDRLTRETPGAEAMAVDLYTLLWLVREFETHPDRYAAPPSPYAGAARIEATPDDARALWPVTVADGSFEVLDERIACWRLPAREPVGYLYFDVDDQFLGESGQDLALTLEFRGTDEAPLIEYDSTDEAAPLAGAYTLARPEDARLLADGWMVARYRLPRARFAGSQNGQADLRIVGRPGDVLVRRIEIGRGA